MYIDVVTKEIDDARQTIKNLQPTIRAFVTNKDFPLEERFRVWESYCDKDNSDIPNSIADKISESWALSYLFNIRDLHYSELIETHTGYSTPAELEAIIEAFGSYDELRELLIQTNFGSYKKI